MEIGDLVESTKDADENFHFSGIGKLHSIDDAKSEVEVVFFVSPSKPDAHRKKLPFDAVQNAKLNDEHNVYHKIEEDYWRRARYGGARPDNKHLLIYNRKEEVELPDTEDIYVLNLSFGDEINPEEFLKKKCTDTPFFSTRRLSFIKSYIEQRAACRSISSLSSSDVDLAEHQIAIVRRILQDENKKYLLADEVGLGKTIEAGLIIKEHILTDENACVFVVTPAALQEQWREELSTKFYLGNLIKDDDGAPPKAAGESYHTKDLFVPPVDDDLIEEDGRRLFIFEHNQLLKELDSKFPTMIVIDETHQIATWAWEANRKHDYQEIVKACQQSTITLLLSGTPISHNSKNYLAMLHLLSPDSYKLNEEGIKKFEKRLAEREELGGLYQSFTVGNDDFTLNQNLDVMEQKFSNDKDLLKKIHEVRPFIDDDKTIDKAKRANKITTLRRFIGENYRIHQRMLRNQREDTQIIQYFPGLKGAKIKQWEVNEITLPIDRQIIDKSNQLANEENYLEWLTLCMQSPSLVADKVRTIINNSTKQNEDNIKFLKNIIKDAQDEQKSKDELLDTILSEWLEGHKKGKIIIFCMTDNLADHVFQRIYENYGVSVERYSPEEKLKFNIDDDIRILVCDHRGEDGLNLHGGEKLLIHYALPKSLSAIEQRNGRANRYSANVHAKPVESIILTPNDDRSVIYRWVYLLDNTINIFKQSIASLQHVLEEEIDKTWGNLYINDIEEFDTLEKNLSGEKGQIELERKKVRAQEQLNSLEEEILLAREFANELIEADEKAEEHADSIKDWIKDALKFHSIPGPLNNTFRFKYRYGGGRGPITLMSVEEFLKKCITGINKDESDYQNIVTHWMSPFRALPSKNNELVYPLRFGQPFVDTIYQAMEIDTRGVCSVSIRFLYGTTKKERKLLYFGINWMVDATQVNSTKSQQRIDDEHHKPKIIEHWIDAKKLELITDEKLIKFLTSPYSKDAAKSKEGKVSINERFSYIDKNIGNEREWKLFLNEFEKDTVDDEKNTLGEWSEELIDHVIDTSKKQLDASLGKDTTLQKKIISINTILFAFV